MSFRNRCIVAGSTGLIHLSVPLQNGRDQKAPIRDIRINRKERWRNQHWRTLFSCYGRAPFFEFYSDWLEAFYGREYAFLFDMNLDIFYWLKKVIPIPGETSLTEAYLPAYPSDIKDFRNRWLPRNFQQQPPLIRYNQVFEPSIGFQPNLSILDLLFCEGPQRIADFKDSSE